MNECNNMKCASFVLFDSEDLHIATKIMVQHNIPSWFKSVKPISFVKETLWHNVKWRQTDTIIGQH